MKARKTCHRVVRTSIWSFPYASVFPVSNYFHFSFLNFTIKTNPALLYTVLGYQQSALVLFWQTVVMVNIHCEAKELHHLFLQ